MKIVNLTNEPVVLTYPGYEFIEPSLEVKCFLEKIEKMEYDDSRYFSKVVSANCQIALYHMFEKEDELVLDLDALTKEYELASVGQLCSLDANKLEIGILVDPDKFSHFTALHELAFSGSVYVRHSLNLVMIKHNLDPVDKYEIVSRASGA